MQTLTFEEIQRFCKQRPTELSRAPSKQRDSVVPHGDFEGYGDLFDIQATDVEYVQLAGRVWVEGLTLRDWGEVSSVDAFWKLMQAEYSGRALAIWASDAKSLERAAPNERFVIVAGEFVFTAGLDWESR